ncbi:MAG: sulfotransferase [Gammaproteobacteria bacterium]|nr:sulfotransferase [Gammaproteobacteria bacterium]
MQNFLILGTQRTGSSAFAEALGRHPAVVCGAEWLNHVRGPRKAQVASLAFAGHLQFVKRPRFELWRAMVQRDVQWLGFRWLFRANALWAVHPRFNPTLWLDGLETCLSWLAAHPKTHVIHIVRRDAVDWLKSKYLARETQSYWGKSYPAAMKVRIPVREACARVHSKAWIDRRLGDLRHTNPYHVVHYEDFRENDAAAVGRALAFLGCDPARLRQGERRLQRQSAGGAADYILNHAELTHALGIDRSTAVRVPS